MLRGKTDLTSLRATGGLPDGVVWKRFVSWPIGSAKFELDQFKEIFANAQLGEMAERPWYIRDRHAVEEAFYYTARNLEGRGNLNKITFDTFAETFELNDRGIDLQDELLRDQPDVQEAFKMSISEEGFWTPEDAVEEEFGALAAFVAGLVTPQYPRRISVEIAVVCLQALRHPYSVNWAKIFFSAFQEAVLEMRSSGGKSASYLAPWLYNLWKHNYYLTESEQKFYSMAHLSLDITLPERRKERERQEETAKSGEEAPKS